MIRFCPDFENSNTSYWMLSSCLYYEVNFCFCTGLSRASRYHRDPLTNRFPFTNLWDTLTEVICNMDLDETRLSKEGEGGIRNFQAQRDVNEQDGLAR